MLTYEEIKKNDEITTYIKKGNDMKIKVYSLLSIGIFMSQSTQAKRFIEAGTAR